MVKTRSVVQIEAALVVATTVRDVVLVAAVRVVAIAPGFGACRVTSREDTLGSIRPVLRPPSVLSLLPSPSTTNPVAITPVSGRLNCCDGKSCAYAMSDGLERAQELLAESDASAVRKK